MQRGSSVFLAVTLAALPSVAQQQAPRVAELAPPHESFAVDAAVVPAIVLYALTFRLSGRKWC